VDFLTAAVAVISFLCVFAFFIVFSFGFSKKGIIVLISTAFLLALFGILASSVFPLWESYLITFLLVLCVSYLFEKRLAFLFVEGGNHADAFPGWGEQEVFNGKPGAAELSVTYPENIGAAQTAEDTAEPEREPSLADRQEKVGSAWEELENPAAETVERPAKVPVIETGTGVQEVSQDGDDEETDFLENRLAMLEQGTEESPAETEDALEMYPVEDWITELENPDTSSGTHTIDEEADLQVPLIADAVSGVEEEEKSGQVSPPENVQYFEQEEIPLLSPDEVFAEKEAEGNIPGAGSGEEIQPLALEETEVPPQLVQERSEGCGESPVKAEHDDLEAVTAGAEEHVEKAEVEAAAVSEPFSLDEKEIEPVVETNTASEKVNLLRKQLLDILIEQLHLARLTRPAEEYEQLVKEHLQPSLPKEDYFAFAGLLIEHYIAEHDFDKLGALLEDLSEKYAQYPVIRDEILFLKHQYCQ